MDCTAKLNCSRVSFFAGRRRTPAQERRAGLRWVVEVPHYPRSHRDGEKRKKKRERERARPTGNPSHRELFFSLSPLHSRLPSLPSRRLAGRQAASQSPRTARQSAPGFSPPPNRRRRSPPSPSAAPLPAEVRAPRPLRPISFCCARGLGLR